MFARCKVQAWLVAFAAILAALAAALLDEPVASAQGEDRDYVDVGLILKVPESAHIETYHALDIVVVNNGSRTAYDVEVVVNLVYPEVGDHPMPAPQESSFFMEPDDYVERFRAAPLEVPVGSVSVFRDDGGHSSLRWSIPALAGLQRKEVRANVVHSIRNRFESINFAHEFSGYVTTASFDSNPGNNEGQVWSYNLGDTFNEVLGNYTIDVTVDNAYPSQGDTVIFTITADRQNPYSGTSPPLIDVVVDIDLIGGLAVNGEPKLIRGVDESIDLMDQDLVAYDVEDVKFTFRTLTKDEPRRNSVTLPVVVSSGTVVNDQCLTAALTGQPPPGTGPHDDDMSDNVAKLCLGEPPDSTVVFNSGTIGLPTWYNCVDRTTFPCGDTASVEFVVLGGSAAMDAGLPYTIFEPDMFVIQVPDPSGRAASSEEGSSDLVWSTGVDEEGSVVRSGVIVSEELVSLDPGQWGFDVDNDGSRAADLKVEVSGPGKLSTWSDGSEWFGSATNGELTSGTWYVDPGSFPWYAEFSKLGTYRVDFGGEIAQNNGTPTNPGDDTSYTIATRTHVFHVGPIAELEVRDGGSHVSAGDQSALTIVAVNNGPDSAPAARVTGLPADAVVLRMSQGNYVASDGVWSIGDLKIRDSYLSSGLPVPTLVLSAAAGEFAEVSIASSNYEVCIGGDRSTLPHTNRTDCQADTTNGGSWHTGPVYDYNDANNTATITARAGARGESGGPVPNVQPMEDSPESVTVLEWDPVKAVNSWPVTHYEVQKSSSAWGDSEEVTTTRYIDLKPGTNPLYRVRAVNLAGVPGPWSTPIGPGGGTAQVGVTVHPTTLEVDEGKTAEYSVSLGAPPEADVTINIDSGGNPDITTDPTELVFNASNWRQKQTVTVHAAHDIDGAPDETTLTHEITSEDAAYRAIRPSDVTVRVKDDDNEFGLSKVERFVNTNGLSGSSCGRFLPENTGGKDHFYGHHSIPREGYRVAVELGRHGQWRGIEYHCAAGGANKRQGESGIDYYFTLDNTQYLSLDYEMVGPANHGDMIIRKFPDECSPSLGNRFACFYHKDEYTRLTSSDLTEVPGSRIGIRNGMLYYGFPLGPGRYAINIPMQGGHPPTTHHRMALLFEPNQPAGGGGPSGDGGEASHAQQWTQHQYATVSSHRVRVVVNYSGSGPVEAELFRVVSGDAESQRLCQGSGSGTFTLCEQDVVEAGSYLVVVYADPDDHTVEFQQVEPAGPGLAGLSLDDVALTFSPATTEYAAWVPHATAETVIRATATGPGASVSATAGGSSVNVGDAIALAVGDTVIVVTVSDAGGNAVASYTVTVTRGAETDPEPTEALLTELSLDNVGTLGFDPATTEYTVQVPYETTETAVRATASVGALVSVKAHGSEVDLGEPIALEVGGNVINVTATSVYSSATDIYTVTVTRAAAPPPDAPADANEWSIYISPDSGTRPADGQEQIGQDVRVFVRCNGELRFNEETCPFEAGSMAFQIQADGSGRVEATHRDDFGGPRKPFIIGQRPDSDFTVALVNMRPASGDENYDITTLTDAERQYFDYREEHVPGAEYIPFVLLRDGEVIDEVWFQLKPADGAGSEPSGSNTSGDGGPLRRWFAGLLSVWERTWATASTMLPGGNETAARR